MNLLDPSTGGQVQAPGICFICEHHFDQEHRLIDTGHSFLYGDDPRDLINHLHGVKYICEHCSVSAASVVMGTDLRNLANELVSLQAQVDEANAKLAAVEGMDDQVIEQMKRIYETRTFARPGPRPKAARVAE